MYAKAFHHATDKTMNTSVNAAILVIGNEILSGKTKEANMAWITDTLTAIGIQLHECRIVRDDETAIISAINALRSTHDYVFTSGGIGPTHDDITSATIAKAFSVELITHPEAERTLRDYYEPDQQTDARMKMAMVPQGASLIPNPVSAAPGFIMENVYVMAGVPKIFQSMVQQIKPKLTGGEIAKTLSITAFAREGDIATPLSKLQTEFAQIEIGSYPFLRGERFGAQLVFTGTDKATLHRCKEAAITMLKNMGVEYALE